MKREGKGVEWKGGALNHLWVQEIEEIAKIPRPRARVARPTYDQPKSIGNDNWPGRGQSNLAAPGCVLCEIYRRIPPIRDFKDNEFSKEIGRLAPLPQHLC